MERIYKPAQLKPGICYMIENQLEYLADEDEKFAEYLNSLSKHEYESLLNELYDEIFEYDEIWNNFDNTITNLVEKRFY